MECTLFTSDTMFIYNISLVQLLSYNISPEMYIVHCTDTFIADDCILQ